MEPIDGDHWIREQALALAVQYATSRPRYNSKDVIDIADSFLNWLTNSEGIIDG